MALITVVKAGVMMTYQLGTGLVVARHGDGRWSAPSAIGTLGLGWGPQVGTGKSGVFIWVFLGFLYVYIFT